MGLHQAGFTVTGVDITGQRQYPFDLIVERIEHIKPEDISAFDLIWASPPCQRWSNANRAWQNQADKPDLVDTTRRLLQSSGVPFIIENVPHAPLRADVMLCGAMFGLRVVRHRIFEIEGFKARQPAHHSGMHHWQYVTVTGTPGGMSNRVGSTGYGLLKDWQEAMGIDWMSARAMSQAVPPAYARYLGEEFARCAVATRS